MTHAPLKQRITKYQELARKSEMLLLAIRKAVRLADLTVPAIEVERILNGLRMVFISLFIFSASAHAEDKRESVTPPATAIGGALALGSLGSAIVAGTKRQYGNTKSARAYRSKAIYMSEAAVGFIILGWWTATYYDHRFGIQTKVEF